MRGSSGPNRVGDLADVEPDLPTDPAGDQAPCVCVDGARQNVVAARQVLAGEILFDLDGAIEWPAPDRFTVEFPGAHHLFHPLLASLGHSCAPNARVDVYRGAVVARRQIRAGEPITRDLLATESSIPTPFVCRCGAPGCRGWIGRPELPARREI